MKLKRELGLAETTLYGIGVILGAGVYALIATGAGLAGNMLWLAFLLSAMIAIFTALSYAELSSIFPKEAAEYNYTKKAFNIEILSYVIGWVLAIGTVIAASTVALAFGGYSNAITGVDMRLAAIGLIIAMSALNYLGITISAKFDDIATVLEIIGLLIVIVAAFISPPQNNVDLFELPSVGFPGILTAISVVFFAYIGFENVANLSEEVKDSRNVVPKALMLALIFSTIVYMLVAIAAIREVGWEALSQSNAPLTLVVSRALGPYASLLSYIALFATANTVLMFLIVPSRILYGMSKGGSIPKIFSMVGVRGTPYFSVALIGLVAALAAFFSEIKTVAQLTDLGVFIAYFAVNASLIALSGHEYDRRFTSPRIFKIPIFAVLGAIAALVMLFSFEARLWFAEGAAILAGILIYYSEKWMKRKG